MDEEVNQIKDDIKIENYRVCPDPVYSFSKQLDFSKWEYSQLGKKSGLQLLETSWSI